MRRAVGRDTTLVRFSLNPCCNGIYSMRKSMNEWKTKTSLNPCCNGIYSMRNIKEMANWASTSVLILVVMEYTQ